MDFDDLVRAAADIDAYDGAVDAFIKNPPPPPPPPPPPNIIQPLVRLWAGFGPNVESPSPTATWSGSPPNFVARDPAPVVSGRLIVVGTGIRSVGQFTIEALAWIKRSDAVFHLAADPVAEGVIRHLNAAGVVSSLFLYVEGQDRNQAYEDMIAAVSGAVRAGKTVCLAMYGHPAVYSTPTHLLVRQLRADGYPVQILPGISAEACLFADLAVEPGDGCLSFDATDFVLYDFEPHPAAHLVIWQVASLGYGVYHERFEPLNIDLLSEKLIATYGSAHKACIYEAPSFNFGFDHRADWVSLADLASQELSTASTLYVPPRDSPTPDTTYGSRVQLITGT